MLVVDNLDMQDPRLSQLLEGRYSMIITSRISREKEGYQELAVQPLNRWEDQLALFKKFYKRPLPPQEEPALREVFQRIGFHTYGIQLLAKQMQASHLSPTAMLDYLRGAAGAAQRRSQLVMAHVLEVMGQIFDLSHLSPQEVSILKNMALLPVEGVETELFFDLTGLEDFMLLDQLIDSSFIQYNCISDTISLHPLMVDTMVQKYPGVSPGLPGLCGKPHPAAKPVYSLQISGKTGASLPGGNLLSQMVRPLRALQCALYGTAWRGLRGIFSAG